MGLVDATICVHPRSSAFIRSSQSHGEETWAIAGDSRLAPLRLNKSTNCDKSTSRDGAGYEARVT